MLVIFEQVRAKLRSKNVIFGLWLVVAPLLLSGGTVAGSFFGIAAGISLVALSLPRGRRSKEHYGSWDRYIL